MSTRTEFQRSRIYAQGWKAAGDLTTDQIAALNRDSAAALNPYTNEMDRTRWSEGFEKALGATGALTFRGAPGFGTDRGPR